MKERYGERAWGSKMSRCRPQLGVFKAPPLHQHPSILQFSHYIDTCLPSEYPHLEYPGKGHS